MNTLERGIEEYKMPSIEVDGHSWIRLIDHIALVDQQLQKARDEAYQAGRAHEAQQCRGSAADNHPNAPYELPELYPWKDSFERLIAKSDHSELDHDKV